MVGKAQKSHGAISGLYGGCSNWVRVITFFQAERRIQFRSPSVRFLGFSNHEKGVPRQEISKWSAVCSTFSRSDWNVVRSVSLDKGDTSKKKRFLLEKLIITRLVKNSPPFMELCKVHYRVHKTPPLVPILSQMHLDHNFTPYSPRIQFNINLHLRLNHPSGLFPSSFPTKTLYAFIISPCVLNVSPISSSLIWST
jgi:hypothetical protein